MIAERPHHGYELIKAIEERLGGAYSPSPGVIYPTLSWLDDMGFAATEAETSGRKRYRITSEGEAFLLANRAAVDALLSRLGSAGRERSEEGIELVRHAMHNLKRALRSRFGEGPLDLAEATRIAEAIDRTAKALEGGQ